MEAQWINVYSELVGGLKSENIGKLKVKTSFFRDRSFSPKKISSEYREDDVSMISKYEYHTDIDSTRKLLKKTMS